MRFSSPGLSVCKKGSVVSLHDALHDGLRALLEDGGLLAVPVEKSVEGEGFGGLSCVQSGVFELHGARGGEHLHDALASIVDLFGVERATPQNYFYVL